MDQPNWQEWNFGDELPDGSGALIKKIQCEAASVVLNQIAEDMNANSPMLMGLETGEPRLVIQLIEDTDCTVDYKLDDIYVATDQPIGDYDKMIASLERLIQKCREAQAAESIFAKA